MTHQNAPTAPSDNPTRCTLHPSETLKMKRRSLTIESADGEVKTYSPLSTKAVQYDHNPLDDSDPLAPPQHLRQAAYEHVNETYERRQETMADLRELVKLYDSKQQETEKSTGAQRFKRSDDQFLIIFLRNCKFRVNKAFCEYSNFCEAKNEHSWLRNVPPSLIERLFASGSFQVLPDIDKQGRLILSMNMDSLIPFMESFGTSRCEELLSVLFGMLEILMVDIRTQIFGIIIIGNLAGLTLRAFRYLSVQHYLLSLSLVQYSYPLRAKGMLLIREPWYVRGLFRVMKSFMKRSAKEGLKCFGNDITAMKNHISEQSLPREFGGALELKDYNHKKVWVDAVKTVFPC